MSDIAAGAPVASERAAERSPHGATRPLAPRQLLVALMIGAGAATISLLGSWIPSLWGDEAASAMSAQRPVPSLLTMLTQVDAVHGTYYFGLHLWVALFGASPLALRLPSALAVGFTAVAVYLLCRRLGTERMALAAAVICAVLPRTTYMGEEARPYAFSAGIAAWLTLTLVALVQGHGRSRALWIAYAALVALGTYVFLYTAVFAVVHLVILALSRRRSAIDRPFLRRWAAATLAGLVAACPVVVLALTERRQIAYLRNKPQTDFHTLTVGLWFGDAWFALLAWSILLAALVTASVMVLRARVTLDANRQAVAGTGEGQPPRLEVIAASWLLVPSVVLIGSASLYPDFTARYLSYCTPAAALLLAAALNWLTRGRRAVLAVAVSVVVATAVPGYLGQRQPFSKNNSDLANISAAIGANAHEGDAVVFDEGASPSHRPRLALHTYPAGFAGLRDVTLDVPYARNSTWYDRAYSVDNALSLGRFGSVDTVWLIEYAPDGTPDAYGIASLDAAGFHIVRTISEHSSAIYELAR